MACSFINNVMLIKTQYAVALIPYFMPLINLLLSIGNYDSHKSYKQIAARFYFEKYRRICIIKFTMAEEFCNYHLNGLEQLVQFHRTTLLSLCVLHFILFPVAAFGNILVIRALWKASSIPANIKKLFLSLAFSDLAVGLFAQLIYAVVLGWQRMDARTLTCSVQQF